MAIRAGERHHTSRVGLCPQCFKLPRPPVFEAIGPCEDRSPPQTSQAEFDAAIERQDREYEELHRQQGETPFDRRMKAAGLI